jgi:hypothetical protein
MFRQSKPLFLDRRGRRSSWRPPGWLVLLIFGIAVGAGGLYYLQERYLPPRLTPAASAELRKAYDEADTERTQLKTALADANKKRDTALAERQGLAEDATNSKASVDSLRRDLSSVVSSLPPDPRGGTVEIRAGWLTNKDGNVSYDLVLTRGVAASSSALAATLQFSVAGESDGAARTIVSKPVNVTIDAQQVLRGTFALPKDFKPGQATIQIAERSSGRSLGMRVLIVK